MASELTPSGFVAKWSKVTLSERAASQEHFLDLCRLLGQPTPAEHDATGAEYTFEKGVAVSGPASRGTLGERGFADVWWRGKFALEYKRKGKYHDLGEAYRQLCQYREALENPPLLIVSDIAQTEIHTNFTGTKKVVHCIPLADLALPENLDKLRRVFTAPESFKPTLTTEHVTRQIAEQFGQIALGLRERGHDPQDAAHFLMKCMFCLFAEDVGLLPKDLFKTLLERGRRAPQRLTGLLRDLFAKMSSGGDFGADEIAYFNGGLFDETGALELTEAEITSMHAAAEQDWSAVEPAIFGTLFERSLDPSKRAQIGAHYTSREDIMLVIEPVILRPLRREWHQVQADVAEQLERRRKAKTTATKRKADEAIRKRIMGFQEKLATVRILDPACGSGNFLYVAIQQLLDLEKEVITFAARGEVAEGLLPQVRPTQLHGIEINPYAAELAQVVIWIGYLQWMRDNGFNVPRDPILEPLRTIECRDAILDLLPAPRRAPEPRHSCRADTKHSRRADLHRGGTYLLTWTTYGTWLPGDERGFVSRVPDDQGSHVIHNLPGEPYDGDEPAVRKAADARRQGAPVKLDRAAAEVCADALREVCEKYNVTIHAGAIMATHVHLVVTSDEAEGPRLLNLFKGVSSRRLGQRFGRQPSGSWWTASGSRRLLREGDAIENAVNYVRNQPSLLVAFECAPRDIPPSRDIHVARDTPGGAGSARHECRGSGADECRGSGADEGRGSGVDECRGSGNSARPAAWPAADFIVGNPPFLGSKLFRQQGLDDAYIEAMYSAFDLPNSSDLCCYWFELARRAIERNPGTRVGLLATQGIRGGANRTALERIKQTGDIFMAWSDREWILDGAAVHVSIVGFDAAIEPARVLNGVESTEINSDLTHGANLGTAGVLPENAQLAYMGTTKGGTFDINTGDARDLLARPNSNGRTTADVVRPWINGSDVTQRTRAMWIIDFGCDRPLESASGYDEALRLVEQRVLPKRRHNRRQAYAERWWIHVEPRPALRDALRSLDRFVVTTRVAKHRIFRWYSAPTLPDSATFAFARSDDYFFGVLHSSVHELWARRQGTQLREAESGFRYTPTTCFETFPLPWAPGAEPVVATDPSCDTPPNSGASPNGDALPSRDIHVARDTPGEPDTARHECRGSGAWRRISEAARALDEQRERWLNPPEWIAEIAARIDAEDDFADVARVSGEEARRLIRQSAIDAAAAKDPQLKKRTLTNLYNERPTWLRLEHERLDRAVLAAYAAVDPAGKWDEDWAEVWVETGAGEPLPADHARAERRGQVDQLVLANLLRLNLERVG